MTRPSRALGAAILIVLALAAPGGASFDHAYVRYAKVIRDHVRMPSVDYSALKKGRAALDAAVDAFAQATDAEERAWTRDQRLAFWINAYNAFTLRAIVDHYPIRAPWLTLQPRNSIRQIDGVWTTMRWRAAGREVTLDDIEHQILRRELKEPRIHFAINCASVSCPPLPPEPYRAETLDAQLDEAARRYLASPEGLRVDGDTLRVSSILDWYATGLRGAFRVARTRWPRREGTRGARRRHPVRTARGRRARPSGVGSHQVSELRLVAQRRALSPHVQIHQLPWASSAVALSTIRPSNR